MLFNSLEYIILFLPITLVVYFFLNKRKLTTAATAWLVFASLFFYSWWNVKYLALIVGSILVNFGVGTALWRTAHMVPGNPPPPLTPRPRPARMLPATAYRQAPGSIMYMIGVWTIMF